MKCPFVGQTFHVSSFAFHISRTIQNGRSQLVTQCKMVQDGTSSHANQVSKQVKIECPISLSKQVVNIVIIEKSRGEVSLMGQDTIENFS